MFRPTARLGSPHASAGWLALDQLVNGPRRGGYHLGRDHPRHHQETPPGELLDLRPAHASSMGLE
jgi:hypothetical protein